LSGGEIRDLLNAFYAVCRWVSVYYLWRPNSPDEGDNFLVELALAGNASHIVTNNTRDLQGAELRFPGLSIVKPEVLLRGN
jgi:predicted nucleic acid-binding protein